MAGFLRDQEIRHHGKEWLSKVTDKDNDDTTSLVRWKPLDDWVAVYEPVHENSELQKKVKHAIETKAEQVLLDTMDRRIVARVLRLLLDVSSQILSKAESILPDDATIAELLNNVNGIVLSYRFGHDDKEYKMEYLRRTATNNVSTILWECLPDENTAAALLELQQKIKKTLLELQSEVGPVVEASLNDLLRHVDAKVEEHAEKRLVDSQAALAFEERLLQLEVAATQVTEAVGKVSAVAQEVEVVAANVFAGDSLLQETAKQAATNTAERTAALEEAMVIQKEVTETALHEKAVELEQDVTDAKEAALREKKQVMSNFAEIVKGMIVNKLDCLVASMIDFLDGLLLTFYKIQLAVRVAETKSSHSLEQLQAEMYDKVKQLALHLQERVEAEVQLVTGTIDAMMLHPKEEADEDAAELEGK